MTTQQTSSTPRHERVIRVFVSSTFRDMHAERDELVLKIFPQLRRLCEERDVTWGEIELRWGITEEQSQRGEVLPICLEEIRRCRPYFIGLLGERYGWIPDAIPEKVLESEPWIRAHVQGEDKKSVTELEILHGVLNNPEMADHAFFYFRDPAYVETVSPESRKDFKSEDSASAEKLKRLKDDIRRRSRCGELLYDVREGFPNAKALGELVLADFTALIDTLYPMKEQPTTLDRERMDHEAFARIRAGVYIGRREYFERLDAHVAGDAPPLVVLGDPGGGKSALLSNWALRYREQHPDDFLLLHFIGATSHSSNAISLLRRIMLELKHRFELSDEIPAEPAKIREAFPNWLTMVAGRGRIVLVLDALNQLEDIDNAPDLAWLPRVLPKYCRVIASTLRGRSLKAIEERGWLEATAPLTVHPLDPDERRQLIHDYLKQYGRDLGPDRTDRVARADQTTNPLYLTVLLNELRVFGQHGKELDDRINWYLEAQEANALYQKVVARWQEVYNAGTTLVRDTLSLLWAARRGLSEIELLEALGQLGRPLPRAEWSPLFLALSESLVSHSGLLTFAHDFLRAAVANAYLPDEPRRKAAHRQLAEYFQQQSTWSNRKLDELPWQLAAAHEWSMLHGILVTEECFCRLNEQNEYELLGYWRQLKPKFDLAFSYTTAFARWSRGRPGLPELAVVANDLAGFLHIAACHAEAIEMQRNALAIDERSLGEEHPRVARDLNNLAHMLKEIGDFSNAVGLMRRALAINENRPGNEHSEVGVNLSGLAQLLHKAGRLAEAESLMRRALRVTEHNFGPQDPKVATRLNNLAMVLSDDKRLGEAEALMRTAITIDERTFGSMHPEVATELGNLAILLVMTHRSDEAEPLVRRAVAIDESTFGPDHPTLAVNLSHLTWLLLATKRFAEAERVIHQALRINERTYGPNHSSVAACLNQLGYLLNASNRPRDAEPVMRRAISIYRESFGPDHPDTKTLCGNYTRLLNTLDKAGNGELP